MQEGSVIPAFEGTGEDPQDKLAGETMFANSGPGNKVEEQSRMMVPDINLRTCRCMCTLTGAHMCKHAPIYMVMHTQNPTNIKAKEETIELLNCTMLFRCVSRDNLPVKSSSASLALQPRCYGVIHLSSALHQLLLPSGF